MAEVASVPLFLATPVAAAPRAAATMATSAASAAASGATAIVPAPPSPLSHLEIAVPLAVAAVSSQAATAAGSAASAAGAAVSSACLMIALPLVGVAGWKALQNAPSVALAMPRGSRTGAPAMSATKPRASTPSMIAAFGKGGAAKSPAKSKEPEFCYGLPGAIAPAGKFDPANLLEGKSEEVVLRFREAEITHGRVGMLASLGFLVQENFHPLFTADGGPAIEQIPKLPPWLWFVMTLGVGIAEAARIQKGWANPYEGMDKVQRLKPGYTPGDLDFDPLGLKPSDPAEFRTMQEKELSHGRLAMLAAAGFLAQEAVTGTTWGQTDLSFENLLLGAELTKMAAQ